MRTIGVVTTSRADYGIYRPILRRLRSDSRFCLKLLVSGSHLAPGFGLTVREIEAEGFEIAARVEALLSSDSAQGTTHSMGLALIGFGHVFARWRPDILVVLGDRFEMHAAALAALPFRIPVAHIHGGEITFGAFDDALRHSMTKLSHLHFVSTREHAERVVQMGEEPWRVTISGAPSLDNLHDVVYSTREELERELDLRLAERFLLVTFHPATLDPGEPGEQMKTILRAVEEAGVQAVVTMPNADPGSASVRDAIRTRSRENPLIQAIESLGTDRYFSLMKLAAAMVGNSSSGIIEAPSFGLPVVNVGSRQAGRTRGKNVVDAPADAEAVAGRIRDALDPAFRAALRGQPNPYGDGRAAERIIECLSTAPLGLSLVHKRFADVPGDRDAR